MRRLLVIGALAACGDDGGGPLGDAEGHVTHYDYRFDVDSRAAHATLTVALDTPGNCIALPFRAEGFDPAAARVDGKAAAAGTAVDATTLRLCGARGREAGETMTLDVDVTIPLRTLSTSQVGYSISRDAQQGSFYYLVSWVGGCDRFGPCDHRPDRFATYTFHVTHPATHRARCPGAITEVSATETRCEFTLDGGPTYSTFGVAVYPSWTLTDQGSWGSARVTLYDRAQTGIAAAIDRAYHAGFVAWMESTFGPYPFGDELRILTAPTYWSGFEHPGNIVLDDLLAAGSSAYLHPVAHVLDHEIAHQWAGDQTTLATTYDFVWKEAMAEYLAFVYEAMADPPAAAATANAWKLFSDGARYYPVPGEAPALFDYYGDVYGPGPLILFRQLEALSSRGQVIAAIQSVLGAPRALGVDELLAALETHTGLDLDAYAAGWIHGTGAPDWPRVMLTYNVGGATDFLVVKQTAAVAKRCAFHVALRGANPGDQLLVAVDTFRNGVDQTIPINPQPPFTVTSTELDPLRECLVLSNALVSPPRRHPWLSARAGHSAP